MFRDIEKEQKKNIVNEEEFISQCQSMREAHHTMHSLPIYTLCF